MGADIWNLIEQAATTSKPVRVELTPGARLHPAKRAPGRPRTTGIRWAHYAGYNPDKGGRPRCALPGCNRKLKRDQRLACCPQHEDAVIAEAKAILEMAGRLAGNAERGGERR